MNTFTPSPDLPFTNVPTPARKKGSILLPVVIGVIALFLVCVCLGAAALLLFNYSPGGRAPINLPAATAAPAHSTRTNAPASLDFGGARFFDAAPLSSPVTAVQKPAVPGGR